MRKIFMFAGCLLMCGGLHAENRKSIVDIGKELKQAKSTTTIAALLETFAETTPQTSDDVAVLGQLMDKYPAQGQKALMKIKDPKLAKAVETECAKKIGQFKGNKDEDWLKLPAEERARNINAYAASQAMMGTLGKLKNRDSLPFLKRYIAAEYDGILSYTASKAIGAIAPDDPAVFQELWNNNDVKHINYNAYGKSLLKEVAQKRQDPGVSSGEKDRILAKSNIPLLGGRSKEEKALMKDILLNSTDSALREEVSIAMVHAVLNNREEADKEFVLKWSKRENSLAQNDVVHVMDMVWDVKFIPELIRILRTGANVSVRMAAARSLGRHQVKESLPELKDCVQNDKDGDVRGACRHNYYAVAGNMPGVFHPADVTYFEKQFKDPRTIAFFLKLKENDPDKIEHLALKRSLEEFVARGSK